MTQEDIYNLLKKEELNDGYLPKQRDAVFRLPFVNSNTVDWEYGIVLEVILGDLPEAKIHTNTSHNVIEYCYYLYPQLTATE